MKTNLNQYNQVLEAEVSSYQRKQEILRISSQIYDKIHSKFWFQAPYLTKKAAENGAKLYSQVYGIVSQEIVKSLK